MENTPRSASVRESGSNSSQKFVHDASWSRSPCVVGAMRTVNYLKDKRSQANFYLAIQQQSSSGDLERQAPIYTIAGVER